jgi:hypothetical protein
MAKKAVYGGQADDLIQAYMALDESKSPKEAAQPLLPDYAPESIVKAMVQTLRMYIRRHYPEFAKEGNRLAIRYELRPDDGWYFWVEPAPVSKIAQALQGVTTDAQTL